MVMLLKLIYELRFSSAISNAIILGRQISGRSVVWQNGEDGYQPFFLSLESVNITTVVLFWLFLNFVRQDIL